MEAGPFEEQAAAELDALYQGALFLQAGDEEATERLVVGVLTRAFHKRSPSPGDGDRTRWLEGELARGFVTSVRDGGGSHRGSRTGGGAGIDGLPVETAVLLRAASQVPPVPRAVLWLVLFRRWSYQDAAGSLDLTREQVRNLLSWRSVLADALLAPGIRRNGTEA